MIRQGIRQWIVFLLFFCCRLVCYGRRHSILVSNSSSSCLQNVNTSFFQQPAVNRLYAEQYKLLHPDKCGDDSKRVKDSRIRILRGGYYSLNHLLINEKYKFLFCPVQKVASTLFTQLFRRLNNDPRWFEGSNGPVVHPRPRALGGKRLMEIMNDPTWTKAIFFRDPVSRLYSAYQNFLASNYTHRLYHLKVRRGRNVSIPWSEIVDDVAVHGHTNIHWNPQTHFCGFHRFWRYYNFYGSFERLQNDGRRLLDRVSPELWEQVGARGWSLVDFSLKPGRHITVNGTTGEIMDYNFTRLYEDQPSHFNRTDCMFCANYAPHRSRSVAKNGVTVTERTRLLQSPFYHLDLMQWKQLQDHATLLSSDETSLDFYDRYRLSQKIS